VAQELGLPAFGVQHHLAHVAAVMVEHGLEGPVLGLGLDGAGWGEDGSLWGSEFLLVDGPSATRLDHGPSFCLPGGEAAAETSPWRCAAGLLWELRGAATATQWMEGSVRDEDAVRTAVSMLHDQVGCMRTTGLGRLYDALAAVLGILDATSFEGQAPLSLERLAGEPRIIETSTLPDPEMDGAAYFGAVVDHLLFRAQDAGDEVEVAAWAQKAVARWVARRAVRLARQRGLSTVVAGGGCLINGWLRHELRDTCRAEGLRFFTNERIPPNDGGLSVGQIQVAAARLRNA
jgi:hydrogenase maturation protein HypF